jgi:hypothetical protein
LLFLKQHGASDEAICQLPKYKFRRLDGGDSANTNGVITMIGSDPPIEHALSSENAVFPKLLISVEAYVVEIDVLITV